MNSILLILIFGLFPVSTQAYLGPGLGAGAVATALGLLASIFLAIAAILYYPIKRALKKIRRRRVANK